MAKEWKSGKATKHSFAVSEWTLYSKSWNCAKYTYFLIKDLLRNSFHFDWDKLLEPKSSYLELSFKHNRADEKGSSALIQSVAFSLNHGKTCQKSEVKSITGKGSYTWTGTLIYFLFNSSAVLSILTIQSNLIGWKMLILFLLLCRIS